MTSESHCQFAVSYDGRYSNRVFTRSNKRPVLVRVF